MIRLYPQAIKSEENIQDLRRVLGEIHDQNHNRFGELLDTGRRIQEISSELKQAEAERGRRQQEARNKRKATNGLRERLQGQQAAGEDLRRLLENSQVGHEQQLQSLAASEHESKEYWDVLAQSESRLEELASQLEEQADVQKQLQGILHGATDTKRTLSSRFREAEFTAATMSQELREAGHQSEEHSKEASGKEALEIELNDQLFKMEKTKIALTRRLSCLHGSLPESFGLQQAIKETTHQLEYLRTRLEHLEPTVETLRRKIDISEKRVRALHEVAAAEDSDYQALRARLDAQLQHNAQLSNDISGVRQTSGELRLQLERSEQDTQELESELNAGLGRCKAQAKDLEAGSIRLEEDLRQRHTRLEGAQVKKQELLEVLAERERGKVDLQAEHKEAEEEYQLEKERCRCVVS